MKKYILIAGVNGVGKSMLYQLLQSLQDMPRDELMQNWELSKDGKSLNRINPLA